MGVLHIDGELELDLTLFELRRDGAAVPLEPQAFDVLAYLVAQRDRVVSKDELKDRIWGGRFVTEAAVTSRIKQVRRALGDDGQHQRLVRTVHGRGYRFLGEVSEEGVGAPDRTARRPEPAAGPTPATGTPYGEANAPIRYTVSDGLHIAYQVTGSGPVDIVLISGFLSHLDIDWGDPRHAHFLHRLGTFGRLIRFDKRGTGMSDRPEGVPDLETRMHDVLAVMNAVGSERAVLLGYSEGGAMATLMAATHPERVQALVLYGSYAKRTWSPDYPWGQDPEERERHTEELVTRWDWEADLRWRCPSSDPDMQRWWARRMSAAATPSTVRTLMRMNALVDVRGVLPAVRVPTLVLHRVGDAVFGVPDAQYLTEHLANAELRLLDGDDHVPWADADQLLDPVEEFLAARAGPEAVPAALAAVVAVGGPTADAVTEALASAGGRQRAGPGDRPVALFDGPAVAVRAALAHVRSADCAGVALAEVPRDATTVAGTQVETAVALADLAPAGCVWLSPATRDLLSGSGIPTAPAGEHATERLGRLTAYEALRDA